MTQPSAESPSLYAVIAGFGVPGRAAAEKLDREKRSYSVIETNPHTIDSAARANRNMIEGDASDPDVLRRAGIESASLFIIAIPDERAALEATRQARRLNPKVHIITRCHFTSAGLEARKAGADDVLVEEQIIAQEMLRQLPKME